MRIIAGTARGTVIDAPLGRDTRPTLDRVRENVFNILQQQVRGARVLDLFSGSGAMAFEAVSRGAASAVLVDVDKKAHQVEEANCRKLRMDDRCRLLLHVVDVSGSECREPVEDFEKINEELAKFSPELAQRPQIVVGNKCDLATKEQIESFRSYVEGKGLTFVPISAATMQGVRELPGLVYNRLKDIPPVPVFAPEYKKPEPKANDRAFEIQRMEAHVWSIDAPWLEYILAGSNVDDYESLQYFQRQLDESGILTELVEKGVQENDTILIGEYQFDYIF